MRGIGQFLQPLSQRGLDVEVDVLLDLIHLPDHLFNLVLEVASLLLLYFR